MMHRRTLLTGLGAILTTSAGGCLRTGSRGGAPANRIDDVTPDAPPDLPLAPSISIAAAESTEDRPMRIAVRWENHQQETVRFGEERSVLFHAAGSDDERALLLGDEYGTWDDAVSNDACWYVSGDVAGDGAYRVGELAPGDGHEVELGLYATGDGCFTTDTYRFQNAISAWQTREIPDHPPTEQWGFDVHVDSADD